MDLQDRLSSALAGRYEIEREIGRGGMAVVYLARDLKLKRRVAIKVLRPEFSASLIADRFVQEIQIASRLEHPLIVALYESDSSDGLLWFAMPFIQGETLYKKLDREKQLPVHEAVRITCEVAEALSYAHGQGVIHRDIKPANILFSDGHPLVADFGIAKAFTEAGGPVSTATGSGIGTVGYMSPEQATGEKNIDARTDIYSLACVLYEMLAGETPYTGPTAQSIIAKQLSLPVPSVCTVRETVPAALDATLRRALSKVPADRFPAVGDFAAELVVDRGAPLPWHWFRERRVALLTAGLAVAAALGVWATRGPSFDALDQNKVMVFPLVALAGGQIEAGAGEAVALMIGSALEHTEPLRWIDGWTWMDSSARGDVARLSEAAARGISRTKGARYYLGGSILAFGDSLTVVVRVHDVAGDSVLIQESESGALGPAAAIQLGLAAATRALPALLDPGRKIDLTPLSSRVAGAVALWIQGEREYRRSQFGGALDFYQRALAKDSALALAALKGAQAASWESRFQEAERLVSAALAYASLLPVRHRDLAQGLRAYLSNDPNASVRSLQAAIAQDPEWSEAHMALGEVFYHYLPAVSGSLDSLAEAAFAAAAKHDTAFSPPVFHLAEIAIRRGDLETATTLVDRFRRFSPDQLLLRQLSLMLACAARRGPAVHWQEAVAEAPLAVLLAGKALSVAGAQPACAERAFREVLSAPNASAAYHWGAFLGLDGLLVAQGRDSAAAALIDSMIASGTRLATALYFLGVVAGSRLDAQAEAADALVREVHGQHYERLTNPQTQWVLGVWHAHRRDTTMLLVLATALQAAVAQSGNEVTAVFAKSLGTQITLLRGDTLDAIEQLRSLTPVARRDSLSWGLAEGLAVEQLLLARILLARGEHQEALEVASRFDHQGPIIFLTFLPASLAVRYQAAVALKRPDLAQAFRARLEALGHRGSSALSGRNGWRTKA